MTMRSAWKSIVQCALLVGVVVAASGEFSKSQAAISEPDAAAVKIDRDMDVSTMVHPLPPDSDGFHRWMVWSMSQWMDPWRRKMQTASAGVIVVEQADYDEVVDDEVAVAETERPMFADDDAKRHKSITLDLAVGFWESSFRKYVDDGRCTKFGGRLRFEQISKRPGTADIPKVDRELLKLGACDGGWAYSMWQIHAKDSLGRDGIALFDDKQEWSYLAYAPKQKVTDADVVRAADLADRRNAIRVSWHMLRKSLNERKNLCGYTGEGSLCPKGDVRLKFATDWMRDHPFKPGA